MRSHTKEAMPVWNTRTTAAIENRLAQEDAPYTRVFRGVDIRAAKPTDKMWENNGPVNLLPYRYTRKYIPHLFQVDSGQ